MSDERKIEQVLKMEKYLIKVSFGVSIFVCYPSLMNGHNLNVKLIFNIVLVWSYSLLLMFLVHMAKFSVAKRI